MKAPAFQFYPADWRTDLALQACTLRARGLWLEMLCLMHDGIPYGHLATAAGPIVPESLARLVHEPRANVARDLAELDAAAVFSRSEAGVIFSRRMVQDEALRRRRAAGGHLSLTNPAVPRPSLPPSLGGSLPPSSDPSLPPSLGGSPSSPSSSSVLKPPPSLREDPPASGGVSRVSKATTKAKARKFSPAPKPGKTEKARGGGFGTRRPPGKPEPPPASAAAVALAATYGRCFQTRFKTPAPPGDHAVRVCDELLTTYTADELEPLMVGWFLNGTRWAREQHAWSIDGFKHELPTLISLQKAGDL